MFSKQRIWVTLSILAGFVAFSLLGPLHWLLNWAKHIGGPLAPIPVSWAVGVLGALLIWWYSRHLYAKAIFRTARTYGYDICGECGYWLRGLGDDVKHCPECGAERRSLNQRDAGH